jgi:asparagine synthase (glutamine-hydrolysing)
MRRALASIIPQGILERRRKAFVVRAPLESMAKNSEALFAMTTDMACESGGFVDSPRFAQVLREACRGLEVASVPILRTVQLEQWLKHIIGFGITNLSNFGPEPSQSDISGLVRSRNFEQGKEVKT